MQRIYPDWKLNHDIEALDTIQHNVSYQVEKYIWALMINQDSVFTVYTFVNFR